MATSAICAPQRWHYLWREARS